MKNVNSTLIDGGKVKLVESFDTKKIILKYQNENNLNVDRFFTDLNNIDLYECLSTGYRFYYPERTIGDALFYKDLATNRSNYYSSRWEHEEAIKHIKSSDKVLEIGSGFGRFLSLLLKNDFKDIKGIELSELAVETCKAKGLDVESKLIEELNTDIKFDVICSFQVLEHVYDVNSFLKNSINSLKSGGKLIIGVPNNNPFLHIIDKYHTLNLPPHHAGLWSEKSLKSLVKFFPVQVTSINCEPLENSYSYFLNFYIQNSKNFLKRNSLKLMNKISKKLTEKFLSKFVSGRNILIIYTKD